jgi:hypothetical protein
MVRFVPFPFENGRFPAELGAVVQVTVLEGREPARLVVHASDGSWMVGDGVDDHNLPGASIATHISHVVERDASVAALATLGPGRVARRDGPGWAWEISDHVWEDEAGPS